MEDFRKYLFTFIPQIVLVNEFLILKGGPIGSILSISIIQLIEWIIILLCVVFVFIFLRLQKNHKYLRHQLEIQNQELQSIVEDHKLEAEKHNKESKKQDNLSEFKDGVIEMLLHDLKNPLNLIMNYQFFSEELLGHAANQMLNIVTTIGDVQKYEKTKMYVDIREVHVFNILKNAYDQVEFLFKLKKINYYNNIEEDLKVYADEKLLERIFVNLLLNAEKFTQQGGDITIKAENIDKKVKIAIIDSGNAIPEDIHKLVFDKFGLLIAKKSNPARAGNLGLSFCKLVLDAHNERIAINSNQEQTTFWFTLKAVDNNKSLNTKSKPQFDKLEVNLSDLSKLLLKQAIKDLKLLKVYEFSSVRIIINRIEDFENEDIKAWLTNLKLAVKSGDEDKYNDLIKLAE